jgi:hypothetical protein
MDFQYKNNTLVVTSDKKNIIFSPEKTELDGLVIDCAGEYEKSGFLMYLREYNGLQYYHFRVEGYWMGYIPVLPEEIDGDTVDFLGQLDILIAPVGKKDQKLLDVIEPRLLIAYGTSACEMPQALGYGSEMSDGYKFRAGDLSDEKMGLVVLA